MGGRHVAILLATKNGSGFLNEQLRSYDHQTHRDWSLHVSDDGSSDETCTIVRKFAREGTRTVSVRDGPKQGYWQNFMSLAQDRNLKADYFAFSDQDDVWYADKLERAMNYRVIFRDGQECCLVCEIDDNGVPAVALWGQWIIKRADLNAPHGLVEAAQKLSRSIGVFGHSGTCHFGAT
jgi:glycosyltransferase involved in cell wall biosynthesis